MSEQAAMTVEQALVLVRGGVPDGFTYRTWHDAAIVLADEVAQARNTSQFHKDNHLAAEKEIATLQARVAELEAEKWNAQIAEAALLSVEKERDGLLSQLPEGMKHCTIIFKECDKGHGWLTATNWVQHGCPKCEFDRLVDEKHEFQRLLRQSSNMVSALHLEACQWRIKAEKAEQERDGLAAKCAELERQAQAIEDSEACAGAALMLVHDRFMRGVLTKEIMIEAVNSAGTRSIARIKAEAVREFAEQTGDHYVINMAIDYNKANQIEGGA